MREWRIPIVAGRLKERAGRLKGIEVHGGCWAWDSEGDLEFKDFGWGLGSELVSYFETGLIALKAWDSYSGAIPGNLFGLVINKERFHATNLVSRGVFPLADVAWVAVPLRICEFQPGWRFEHGRIYKHSGFDR